MDLRMNGVTVTGVELDFSLRISGSPLGGLAIEGPLTLEHSGTVTDVALGDRDLTCESTFDFLRGRTIVSAQANDGTGRLTVVFDDGTTLVAHPVEGYESWDALDLDRVQYICGPGGAIVTFGRRIEEDAGLDAPAAGDL